MIRQLLNSRGAGKFRQNRLAVVSLLIILLYLFVAGAVGIFGLFTLEETLDRVGPNNLVGLWGTQTREKRLADCLFYIELAERELKRLARDGATGDFSLSAIQMSTSPTDELNTKVEHCWELYEEVADTEDLNEAPELWPLLDELEAQTKLLFTGFDSWSHGFRVLLGTDRQGRSITIRAIYSIKVAVQVGAVTALISVATGGLLGAAAAFYGGWVDMAVIGLYSTLSSIPHLVLLILLAFMFSGTAVDDTLFPVYAAFCLTFWIGPCRVVRGEVLKLKELEYVQAATAIGFGRFRILMKHLIPNAAHLLFIYFSLLFIGAIKSEVILSFLNLGVKKGPSWGIMIDQSRQEVINGFFWQIGSATAFMLVLVLSFNILTDALQDAFDPKHVK